MADPIDIPDKNIPEFFRRAWQKYQDDTRDIREASQVCRNMWIGGEKQWRDGEIAARIASNRPYVTINRCRPAIDQIENEASTNPPGPKAEPVGGQADSDGADIFEGMIREYEYRSNAPTAYVTALRYAASGKYGVFELATEYAGERSMEQQLVVKQGEDPDAYFYDTDARMPAREDSMWGGKIRMLSREKLIAEYGKDLAILNRNMVDRYAGWMQSALGWSGNQSSINLWTGGTSAEGPFFVCEGYRVIIKREKLTSYSDHQDYFEGETIPNGVVPKLDEDEKPISRTVPRRKVKKYVVTALDVIAQTDWLGSQIPHFWVLGPQLYNKGKLEIGSALDGAIDSNRGLNYAATAAFEVIGGMNKSSALLGYQGQFDVANAQGINPWDDFSTKMYSRMEIKPVYTINPSTKMAELLPMPQRNAWEAPIARMLELATWAGEQIKAATSVFFDPAAATAAQVQSGEAIKELQSQTNIGTINWQNSLHYAVALSYGEAAIILPKIKSGPQVAAIVRPDSKHELVEINREFPNGEVPKGEKRNSIVLGKYSLRVTAGPNYRTRTEQALDRFMEVLKMAPQITQAPGILAQIVRMVGEGSPQMEQMADSLAPQGSDDLTPDQLKQRIMQLQQGDQEKQQLILQLQQALMAKLPEIQAKERIEAMKAAIDLAKAEIAAKAQTGARQSADQLAIMDMAHEAGTQAVDHQHEKEMQAADQQHQQQMPAVQQAAQPPEVTQ